MYKIQEERPILHIKKKTIDHIFVWGTWLLLIGVWILSITSYSKLPSIIPTHYGLNGQADGFGHKSTIFLLPGITTAIVILLSALCKFPHKFNYLTKIDASNAMQQYSAALRLMRFLQFFITNIFGYLTYKEISGAINHQSKLEFWLIPLLLFGSMGSTVYTVYISLSKRKTIKV